MTKQEKRCPCCNEVFYGYKNQIYKNPKHGYIFRNYNHISNYPPYMKRIEEINKKSTIQ